MASQASRESSQEPARGEIKVVRTSGYVEDYANSVQINMSVWDFFLQFGRLKIAGPTKVIFSSFAGVYMSPQQAKALHLVLKQNISQYESKFGKIQIDNAPPGGNQGTTMVQ